MIHFMHIIDIDNDITKTVCEEFYSPIINNRNIPKSTETTPYKVPPLLLRLCPKSNQLFRGHSKSYVSNPIEIDWIV